MQGWLKQSCPYWAWRFRTCNTFSIFGSDDKLLLVPTMGKRLSKQCIMQRLVRREYKLSHLAETLNHTYGISNKRRCIRRLKTKLIRISTFNLKTVSKLVLYLIILCTCAKIGISIIGLVTTCKQASHTKGSISLEVTTLVQRARTT